MKGGSWQTCLTNQSSNLEIGHVLFVDIVGYSKLLIDRQSEVLEALKQIVRETASVRAARDRRDLIRLPTGDGMALVFRENRRRQWNARWS